MKKKPELPDDEIRSYMDFEGLLEKQKAIVKVSKFAWLKWAIPAAVVISGVTSWFYLQQQNNIEDKVLQTDQSGIVRQEETTPDNGFEPQPEVKAEDKDNVPLTVKLNDDKEEAKVPDEIPTTKVQDETLLNKEESVEARPIEVEVQESVYIQAEPVNGYAELYEYFNANLVYPTEAIKDSIQGVITVVFVITKDGKPDKIEIKQSLGEPFEQEAKRLIENMPLWNPATLNGKAVPSKVSVPLTFQIQRIKNNE